MKTYPVRIEGTLDPAVSRWLWLVKWLLAVPHLLIVAILLGGGPYLSYHLGDSALSMEGGGLIGLLTVIAGFVLLFTGRYPRDLFDLIIGLNRWAYRVTGYFFLMTDEYPPFRLDTTDHHGDPSGSGQHSVDTTPAAAAPAVPTHQWTAGRVVSAVAGSLLILFGLGALPAGGTALWFDQTGRDSDGYLTTDVRGSSSPGYAIATETGALRLEGSPWAVEHLLGDVRITGTSRTSTPLFIGIAAERNASSYLAPIEHTVVAWFGQDPVENQLTGSAPSRPPGTEQFWAARSSGTAQQVVAWQPQTGDWRVVVLNADGSRAVQADLSVGATIPWLDDLGYSLIVAGLVFLLGGALLIVLALRTSEERPDERL